MNTQGMLRVFQRHTREAVFQATRIVVNYRKGQKQLKKITLHLESTLARPPIYDRASDEKLSTASPSNSVGVIKPGSMLLFVQPHKKSLEKSKDLNVNYFLTKFGKNP